ncbi:hypothetical protein [Dyella sp. ASV21]|uniref:hypothetical protein n=1 Tax=Dyella sp. ASV21 TaxID=2795114 RepID=UPI0018EC91A9|nr:hypothetical protein [Dyella sp. ASV21]
MELQAKDKIWFVVSVLTVYLLLDLAASPMIHPYFRDISFYALEIFLAAFLLFLSAARLYGARPYILLIAMCAAGYLLGAVAYLIKWTFLDHRVASVGHLTQIGSSVLSANLWLMAIFTYRWLSLPIATLAGRWIANNFKGKAALGKG